MEMKTCTKCGMELPATREFFHVGKKYKLGLRSWCKKCCKQYILDNEEQILQCRKEYYCDNREQLLEQKREYFKTESGKAAHNRAMEKYNKTDNGKITWERYVKSEMYRASHNKANRKYKQTDKGRESIKRSDKKQYEKNRLSCCMSSMIYVSLKGDKNSKHWETLVPYTLEDLKQHLESLFQSGMAWENHTLDGWHIDHKIPISSFNVTSYDCEDFKKCWALKNLQPLWADENLKKGAKLNY